MREWSRQNKDRIKGYNRVESARAASRRRTVRNYGITVEQYAEMLKQQHGVCAICGEPETHIRKGTLCQLAIDHDHETGQIHGLLCNNCNRAIGLLQDNSDTLRRAADYLDGFAY